MGFGFGASDVYTATALALKVILIVPQYRTTRCPVRAPFALALYFSIAARGHAYFCHKSNAHWITGLPEM